MENRVAALPIALAILVGGASIAALVPAGASAAGATSPEAVASPETSLGPTVSAITESSSVSDDSAVADAAAETAAASAKGTIAGTLPANPRALAGNSRAIAANRTLPGLPERWQRTFGGDGDDTFADLVRTPDGGYLLVGWTERDGDDDGWIVKVDSEGEEEWSKILGDSGTDQFRGLVRTDEGYLAVGQTEENGTSNGWVVEVDSEGEVLAERTPGTGAFHAVVRTGADNSSGEPDDAGYLLAGRTYGEDGDVGWLLGLDADREQQWQTEVSLPEGYSDGVLRAAVPTESGYYLAGKLTGESDDGWALKVDSDGRTEWSTAVGGPDRDDVWAAAPASSTPGEDGFVLAGETESDSEGPRDGWLVRFGPDGAVTWERSPGGNGTQWLDSAMRTDEGFLFTGASDRGPHGSADGYVLSTDDSGRTLSERYYGTSAWDKPWPAIRAHGEGYLLAGKTMQGSDDGDGDGWLVRIGGSGQGGTTTANASTADASPTGTTTGSADAGSEDSAGSNDASESDAGGGLDETAIEGETRTATEAPGVPGFGVGAAVVAVLLGALAALRR